MNVEEDIVERAYLDAIQREVAVQDTEAAQRIRAEIAAHIAEAKSDAEVRGETVSIHDIIAEIGDPRTIAAAIPVEQEAPRTGPSSIAYFDRLQPMTYVWITCLMIIFVTSLFFIGWAAGMVMMWTSSLWSRRVKIWATAILPSCFLLALLWFDFVWVGAYAAPVVTAALLFFTSRTVKDRREARRAT